MLACEQEGLSSDLQRPHKKLCRCDSLPGIPAFRMQAHGIPGAGWLVTLLRFADSRSSKSKSPCISNKKWRATDITLWPPLARTHTYRYTHTPTHHIDTSKKKNSVPFHPSQFCLLLRQGLLCSEGVLKLMMRLPPPPECWDFRYVSPPHPVGLGIKLRASCMLSKYSTKTSHMPAL